MYAIRSYYAVNKLINNFLNSIVLNKNYNNKTIYYATTSLYGCYDDMLVRNGTIIIDSVITSYSIHYTKLYESDLIKTNFMHMQN